MGLQFTFLISETAQPLTIICGLPVSLPSLGGVLALAIWPPKTKIVLAKESGIHYHSQSWRNNAANE
jgi:hypothetical protein